MRHRVRLVATDRHLAGAGQVERPDLVARKDDQLITPLRRHWPASIRPPAARRLRSFCSPARGVLIGGRGRAKAARAISRSCGQFATVAALFVLARMLLKRSPKKTKNNSG